MNGVAAICGFTGILALVVSLLLFLPAAKLKPYRKLAMLLSIGGVSLFAIGVAITPDVASSAEREIRNPSSAGRADTVPAAHVAQEPILLTPDHNYLSNSGGVYYYAAASILDDAEDRTAQEIHGFEYAGRKLNPDSDTVFEVNSMGMPLHTLWCGNPCSIIHADDGHMLSYQPTSVIGMVFQDIAAGKLKSIDVRPIDPPHVVGPSSIY